MKSKTWRRGWSALLAVVMLLSIVAQPLDAAAQSIGLYPEMSTGSENSFGSTGTLTPASSGGQSSTTPNDSGYSNGYDSSTQGESSTLAPSDSQAGSGSTDPSADQGNGGTGSSLAPNTGNGSGGAAGSGSGENATNGGLNPDTGVTGDGGEDNSNNGSGGPTSNQDGEDSNGDANATIGPLAAGAAGNQQQLFDEDGNPLLDEEGNPVYVEVDPVSAENLPGSSVDTSYLTSNALADSARARSFGIMPMAGGASLMPEVSLKLEDWIVYDHYWSTEAQKAFGSATNVGSLRTEYKTQAQRTAAGVGYPYGTTGKEDIHPYYYTWDRYASVWNYNTGSGPREYNFGVSGEITRFENQILFPPPSGNTNKDIYDKVVNASQHIYQKNTSSTQTEITMFGYGSVGRSDWALAPIKPEFLKEVKSSQFDVNMGRVIPHTLNAFGILFNTGIESGTMKGYALTFMPPSKGTPVDNGDTVPLYLTNFLSGFNANTYHVGAASNATYSIGSLPKQQLYYSPTGSGIATTAFPGIVVKDTYNRTVRVNIEASPTKAKIWVSYYDSNYDVIKTIKLAPRNQDVDGFAITDSGHSSFGPYMGYSGTGHNCSRLSWAKFERMSATLGSNVFYYDNIETSPDFMTPNEVKDSVLGMPTGTSLKDNGLSLTTKLPQWDGHVFTGWATTRKPTAAGYQKFDENFKVTDGVQNVYAQWEELKIDVSYNPAKTVNGTNQNVTATFDVKSASTPDRVYIKYADGTEENVTVTPAGVGNYRGSKVYDKNLTGAKIWAVVKDGTVNSLGQPNTATVSADLLIDWIDKTSPVITPPANNTALTAATAITITDPTVANYYTSGVDTAKTVITLTASGGAKYTGNTWAAVWSQVSSKTDVYTLTVQAWDRAGNPATETRTGVYVVDPSNPVIKINVTYSPTTWVKGDGVNKVTATVKITSAVKPTVTVGGAAATVTGTAPNFQVIVEFKDNKSGVPVVATTSIPGYGANSSLTVTWLDKNKPTATLPTLAADKLMQFSHVTGIKNSAKDVDDPAALLSGARSSGVSSTELWLYKVTGGTVASAPTKYNLASLTQAQFNAIAGGEYYYDVVVTDKVGWIYKASDKYSGGLIGPNPDKPGPKPGDKEDPSNPPVIINPKTPTIALTPDRAANSNGWYNADVTMKVVAGCGGVGFKTVSVANTLGEGHSYNPALISGTAYTGTFKLTKEGTHALTGNVTNTTNVSASGNASAKIDKTKPVISITDKGTTLQLSDIQIGFNDALSGIDKGTMKVVIKNSSGTAVVTLLGEAQVLTLASKIAALPSGEYKVETSVSDLAGNSATNNPSTTYTHTNTSDNHGVTITITYAPARSGWVKPSVVATIKVESKTVMTGVTIDGAKVSDFNASTNKYSYTTTRTFAENKSFAVNAILANGKVPTPANGKVDWIDRLNPEVRSLPDLSSKNGVLTQSDLSGVTFTDPKDATATYQATGASGINTGTKELWLYRVNDSTGIVSTTPIKINWSNLSTLSSVEAGKYYYDVVVKDNVTNEGKASDYYNGLAGTKPDPDKPGPEPGKPDPEDPDVPPVIINGKNPTITLTPDRSANAHGWYNADVTMKVNADGGKVNFKSVNVANTLGEGHAYNTANIKPGYLYEATFKLTKEGAHALTGNVENIAALKATQTKAVNIDKTNPTIVITDKGSDKKLADISIVFDDALSKVDPATPNVTIKNSSGTAVVNLTGAAVSNLLTEIAKLPSGEYTVETKVSDKAGNSVTNNPSYKFNHTDSKDNHGVKVEITYNPTRSKWVQPTVTATIKVTSLTPMTGVTIDGVKVGDFTAANQYSYTTTRVFSENKGISVNAILANGAAPTPTAGKVDWIDRLDPTVRNLPDLSSKNGRLTSSDLSGVQFADVKDAAATYTSDGFSGIEDSSREIWLYRVDDSTGKVSTTPVKIKWSNLSSLSGIPGGKYYYDVVVSDKVGNIGKASDFYNGLAGTKPDPDKPGPEPGKPDPEDPDVPPVIINADDPEIKLTPDRPANSHGWYNADITMKVDANGGKVDFKTVNVANTQGEGHTYNTANIKPGYLYEATFKLTKEGVHTLTGNVENIAALKATESKTLKIDKTNPVITITDKGGKNELDALEIKGSDALSGLDDATWRIVIKDDTGKTVVDLSGTNVSQLPGKIAALPSGEYKLETSVNDKAGNSVSNNPTTSYWHSNTSDNMGVTITISYVPARTKWTQPNVVATIKVDSKTEMTGVTIDGVKVGDFTAANKYSYTTTRTFSENKAIEVNAILASGKVPTATKDKVDWIDRLDPTVRNLPDLSSKNGIMTSADLSGVLFADVKDAAATYTSDGFSGIEDSSREIWLYKISDSGIVSTTPVKIKWSNLSSLSGIEPGKYYYDVVVADKVGNTGKASDYYNGLAGTKPDPDKPGPEPGKPDPEDPDVPPIVVNPQAPKITLTPDRVANTHGWYNADVTIKVNADGGKVDFNTVNVANSLGEGHAYNTANVKPGYLYEASFKLTKEGTHDLKGTVTNVGKLSATDTKEIKIDKTDPVITITDKVGQNNLADLEFKFDDALSGPDNATLKVVITDKSGTPVLTLTGTDVSKLSSEIAKLPSGEYKVQTSMKDKAGNGTSNNPTTTYWHGSKEDNFGVKIDVTYAPARSAGWTKPDVVATVTITSKTEMSGVKINGKAVTLSGNYSYTTKVTYAINDKLTVDVSLKNGKTPAGYDGKVDWIDRLNPTVTDLPDLTSKKGKLEASDLTSNVKFNDVKDVAATYNADGYSGVDTNTRELWLYKVTGGVISSTYKAIAWSDLATELPKVAAGAYYYNIVVKDKVGNVGKASDDGLIGSDPDKPGPGPGPVDPEIPPIIVNADDPVVSVKPDRDPEYQDGGKDWFKDEVGIVVDGSADVPIASVDITDSNSKSDKKVDNTQIGKDTYNDTYKETNEGEHKINVTIEDTAALKGKDDVTVWIDATKPSIDIKDGGNKELDNIIINTEDKESGIDDDTVKIIVTEKDGTEHSYDSGKDGDFDDWVKDLPTGEYTVEGTVDDNVGHTSDPDKETGFWHENEKENANELVKIIAELEVLEPYTASDGKQYTASSVDAKRIVVKSKLPVTKIVVNGTSLTVDSSVVRGSDKMYTYEYNFAYMMTENGKFTVDVTTIGKTPGKHQEDVWAIDRHAPSIKFRDDVKTLDELLSKTDAVTIIDEETAQYARSGEKLSATRYKLEASGIVVEGASLAEVIGKLNVPANSKIYLTVTGYDNVGNETVAKSPHVYSGNTHVKPTDTVDIEFNGGEGQLALVALGRNHGFKVNETGSVTLTIKKGGAAVYTQVLSGRQSEGGFTTTFNARTKLLTVTFGAAGTFDFVFSTNGKADKTFKVTVR